MCGRYAIFERPHSLQGLLEYDEAEDFDARYNVAPTQRVPVLRPKEQGDGLRLDMLRWGLVPSWASDSKIGSRMINARAETLAEKPSFRAAFKSRRCVIPTSGYYEWQVTEGVKRPHFIRRKNGESLFLAGLWESWGQGDDEPLVTCTIITTATNTALESLHHRMPVVLDPAQFGAWFDPAGERETLEQMMAPAADDLLEAYEVDRRVSSVRNDGPACIEPIAGDLDTRSLFD
jgi:putative SOS response-associated peptidase YedK